MLGPTEDEIEKAEEKADEAISRAHKRAHEERGSKGRVGEEHGDEAPKHEQDEPDQPPRP